MGTTRLRIFATLALCGSLVAASARAEDKKADQILAEINAVEMPKLPEDRTNQAAVREYITKSQAALEKRATLIGELFKANPDQPELGNLMQMRWAAMGMQPASQATVKAEIEDVLAKSKDEKLVGEAAYYKAFFAVRANDSAKIADVLPLVDAYIAKYPTNARIPVLLMNLANKEPGTDAQEAIFKRIEKDYEGTPIAKQVVAARARAEGDRRKASSIGKPFALEFTEATKGTEITMASLKGKVVVIDFWATWCPPCVAEMPNMKKLYAEYKDKGVEFIGVSLDQPKEKGGDVKLKEYVAKNDIQWPQYYQGNYWQSDFSASWGINSIPCVFLIDADGNLASVQARGKLETLIPEYLEKAKAKQKTASNP